MKFFIDTANLDDIREAYDMGVLDGVTTNPSLDGQRGHLRPGKCEWLTTKPFAILLTTM